MMFDNFILPNQFKDRIAKRIQKRSTILERSEKLQEGLNMFDGTSLNLNSDVDQDT